MIEQNNGKHNNTNAREWLCSNCGYKLANLINDSAVIFYSGGRQFTITFDSMSSNCPKCNSYQSIESSLLWFAIKETGDEITGNTKQEQLEIMADNPDDALISRIRMKAWGIKSYWDFIRAFPDENVVMPKMAKDKFIETLSVNHKKVYEIMCNTFRGIVGDPKTISAIKDALQLSSIDEAKFQYGAVLKRLREFKHENPDWLMRK